LHIAIISFYAICLFPFFTYSTPSLGARNILSAYATAGYFCLCTLVFIRTQTSLKDNKLLLPTLILLTLLHIFRGTVCLLSDQPIENYMSSGCYYEVILLATILLSILFIAGLLELNSHKLELELFHERAELQQSKDKFHSLSDAAFEGILIVRKGIVLETNTQACKIFGYQPGQLIGMAMSDLLVPWEQTKIGRKNILVGKAISEISAVRKDGSIVSLESQTKSLVFKGEQVLVSAIRDLTERQQKETEREGLIKELQEAADDIKTLSGLLPICGHCKKIRDDQGSWNFLESFIEQRSQALFSHSICPECSDELYGKEDWYINMKRK